MPSLPTLRALKFRRISDIGQWPSKLSSILTHTRRFCRVRKLSLEGYDLGEASISRIFDQNTVWHTESIVVTVKGHTTDGGTLVVMK